MKYKLQAFDILEFGQRKDSLGNPHQEDCLFPRKGLSTADDRLFIVCDGMGGHDAGEVASATVCDSISGYLISNVRDPEGDFTDQTLVSAVEAAFTALNLKDTGAVRKMGTTLAMLKLHSKGCTIAHMGDSRVYQIRPGMTKDDTKVVFVTEDHSLVSELVKCGEITKEEARVHPKKNVITRALQPNMERYPKLDVYHSSDIRPGDYFYLCTDGMLENMDDEQLCYFFSAAAGDDAEKVKKLTLATVSNKDNHSAILVHILDVINPIGPDAVSRKTISVSVTPECHYDANGLTDNNMHASAVAQQPKTEVILEQEIELPSSESDPVAPSSSALGSNQPSTADVSGSSKATPASSTASSSTASSSTASNPPASNPSVNPQSGSSSQPNGGADDPSKPAKPNARPGDQSLRDAFNRGYERGRKGNPLGIIIGIVILLAVCYFLMQTCSNGDEPQQNTPQQTENLDRSEVSEVLSKKYAQHGAGKSNDTQSQTQTSSDGAQADDGAAGGAVGQAESEVGAGTQAESESVATPEMQSLPDGVQSSVNQAMEQVNQNIKNKENKIKEELSGIVNQSQGQTQSQPQAE